MAFTDHCDLFASLHEEGINRIVRHVQRQRPSLFNYGTDFFADDPRRLCEKVEVTQDVINRHNPIVSREPLIPVPGTNGLFGVHWCLQVSKLEIDFHPGNVFTLPPELAPPLGAQRFALHAKVCAAIACPNQKLVDRYANLVAAQQDAAEKTGLRPFGIARDVAANDARQPGKDPPPMVPLEPEGVDCFCLDVFAVGRVAITSSNKLALFLDGLEIVDIKPDGLESSLECLIVTTLRLGLLPKLRPSLDNIVFKLGSYATIGLSPTPVSAQVPNNPDVANDAVGIFINATIS
jgi:hypothetical protein